ncbi:MAG TPA: zeta toxin family protein [Mucilaginibacter sp.]|jgi:predicted ABC-type ATPase|nr:zeta toxin family protein [Mucilaginibacter sp.]
MLPKFRLFAGPNGSGKTSLFEYLRTDGVIHTEFYINADRFEREIRNNLSFNFNAYRVKVSESEFIGFIKSSSLFEKITDQSFISLLSINSGILRFNLPEEDISSYHASFLASYLAEKLFDTQQSFCFETVMSHESKIDLLKSAKSKGYKTYLYFVYTDSPELNIARVKLRALMGLHDVVADLIRSRYIRSFDLLPKALRIADRAYVINNSDTFKVVAEKQAEQLIIKAPISDYLKSLLNV